MKKIFSKIATLSVGLAMAVGAGVALSHGVEKAEAVFVASYTLDGNIKGSGNSYTGNGSATQSGVSWVGQGNLTTQPWRLGFAKNAAAGSVNRLIYSTSAISDDITKIEVSTGNKSGSSFSITSLTISVHSTAADAQNGTNAIKTAVESTQANIVNKTVTVEKTDSTSWSGKFYRINYALNSTAQDASNPKYIQFVSAVFYRTQDSVTYATGVSTSGTTSLSIGGTSQFTATVTPNDADDKSVTWSSSAEDVIRVNDEGLVTAIGEGSATVTATANGSDPSGDSVTASKTVTSTVDNTYDKCDVITKSMTTATSTTYAEWSDVSATNASHSTASYSGKTAASENNIAINNTSGNGIIVSSSSGYVAKKVVAVWASSTASGRILNIYGSNSSSEFSLTNLGDPVANIPYDTDTEAELGEGYRFIAVRSSNNALQLQSLVIYWDESVAASLDLSGNSEAVVGESVEYTATRTNSSATIEWYVDDVKQNSGIAVEGNTSTFTYNASSAGSFVIKAKLQSLDVSETITLNVVAQKVYEKITSADEIYDGVEVIIASVKSSINYVACNWSSGYYLNSATARMDGNRIIRNSSTGSWILQSTEKGYTFKSSANKYLAATGNTKYNNLVEVDALSDDTTYWTIDLSAANIIVNKNVAGDDGDTKYMGAIRYSSPQFKCYAKDSATGNKAYLYRLVATAETDEYAQKFLTANSTGSTCAATVGKWSELTTAYSALSAEAKAIFVHANHNAPESYDDPAEYTVEHAVARYDLAVAARGVSDFMGREAAGTLSAGSVRYNTLTNTDNSGLIVIVVLLSSSIVMVLGIALFTKRKQR